MRVFNGLLTSNWALGFPKYTTGFQSHALVFIIFSGCATLESDCQRIVLKQRNRARWPDGSVRLVGSRIGRTRRLRRRCCEISLVQHRDVLCRQLGQKIW